MLEKYNKFTYNNQLHLSLGENYQYEPVTILSHILRLNNTKVLAQKSWFITDDYQAEFTFKGFGFVIFTPMDSVDIAPIEKNVPNEVSEELYEHIKNFSRVSFSERMKTFLHCLFKPMNHDS